MRIAYVCTDPGIPVFGTKGASIHVQAVLRVLVRHGVEVHLICARTGGEAPPDLADIVVHPLPPVSGSGHDARENSAITSAAAVHDVLDHLHQSAPLDLVYERYALWGRHAMPWAAGHGIPGVLEVNAPLVREQSEHRHLGDVARAEETAHVAISTARVVVGVTPAVTAWARGYTLDPASAHTIANGVDTARVRPSDRPVTASTGTDFVVGFVGSLKPWHGVDVLVEATARLLSRDPTYRLLIVGDGPCAEAIHNRTDSLDIATRVELTGALPSEDVPAQLHRMDVAVAPYPDLPSFYFSPLKLFEYLAAGIPIVASGIGEIPHILDHGRLGSLVPPGDADALAAAIDRLRHDPSNRRTMRLLGRTQAETHDWSAVVARILTLADASHPVIPDAA